MDRTKHTPGPWRTLLYGSVDDANTATRIDVTDSSRMQHNEPHYCTPVAVCRRVSSEGNFSFNPPNAEANARLIAAAPELLAALRNALPFLGESAREIHSKLTGHSPLADREKWDEYHNAYAKVEAAIAKAEGVDNG